MSSVIKAPYPQGRQPYRPGSWPDIRVARRPGEDPSITLKVAEETLARAREEAGRIIGEAHRRAEEIIQEALRGAERILEEARIMGLAQGKEEGYALGRQEAQELLEEAERIRVEALAERKKILRSIEPEMVRLALEVAGKIVHREIAGDPQVVFWTAAEALERVKSEEEVTVRVNPVDAAVIRERRNELLNLRDGLSRINVEEDLTLEPGGCVVETARGTVDARISRQLENIRQAVEAVLPPGGHPQWVDAVGSED